jgi:hypothetical protein
MRHDIRSALRSTVAEIDLTKPSSTCDAVWIWTYGTWTVATDEAIDGHHSNDLMQLDGIRSWHETLPK